MQWEGGDTTLVSPVYVHVIINISAKATASIFYTEDERSSNFL
jgi:oxalate decarboxylase/phosphoglucose isomerase-like protein (cupin superfamily)